MGKALTACAVIAVVAGALYAAWCFSPSFRWLVISPFFRVRWIDQSAENPDLVGHDFVSARIFCRMADSYGGNELGYECLTTDNHGLPNTAKDFRASPAAYPEVVDVLEAGTRFRILECWLKDSPWAGKFEHFVIRIRSGHYEGRKFMIGRWDLMDEDNTGQWQMWPFVQPLPYDSSGRESGIWWWLAPAGVVVVVAAGAFLLWRRRRRGVETRAGEQVKTS